MPRALAGSVTVPGRRTVRVRSPPPGTGRASRGGRGVGGIGGIGGSSSPSPRRPRLLGPQWAQAGHVPRSRATAPRGRRSAGSRDTTGLRHRRDRAAPRPLRRQRPGRGGPRPVGTPPGRPRSPEWPRAPGPPGSGPGGRPGGDPVVDHDGGATGQWDPREPGADWATCRSNSASSRAWTARTLSSPAPDVDTVSGSMTRTPSSPIAPMASSGWNGTPSCARR